MFTVYMLRTNKNTLYTGQTNNLEKRLTQHRAKAGKGAKYLRPFTSFEVVHTEQFETLSEALKREHQLKQMTKQQKETFLQEK